MTPPTERGRRAGARPTLIPSSLRQVGPQELEVVWSDGHRSLYQVAELRRACPCAGCVDEVTGQRTLDPASISDEIKPVRIEPVGRYAFQITWADGHATGIYTFELLRALCPCEECREGGRRSRAAGSGG